MMMKRLFKNIQVILLSILAFSCSEKQHPFDVFLEEFANQPTTEKQNLLEEFVRLNKWPLVDNATVYFIIHDTTLSDVYLTGDMCAWKPDSLLMEHITGTNFYMKQMRFPSNARIEYKYVVSENHLLDLLNPYTGQGGYGKNSALCMPDYVFPKEILLQQKNHISRLDTLAFKSRLLKNERNIYIYQHPIAKPSSPILLFHDGSDYLNFGSTQIILDNLIATGKIPAVHVFFIDPVDRQKEYWLDDAYLRSVFSEMLPKLKKKYALDQENLLGMGGVSLGGLISLHALKNYATELDFVFSQSGALWVDSTRILVELERVDSLKTKVYFDYGVFENSIQVHTQLKNMLKQNQIHFQDNVFNEGHNWANWRAHLPLALTFGLKGNEE